MDNPGDVLRWFDYRSDYVETSDYLKGLIKNSIHAEEFLTREDLTEEQRANAEHVEELGHRANAVLKQLEAGKLVWAADGHPPAPKRPACHKCKGSGWLFWSELDNHAGHDPTEPVKYYTRYPCDACDAVESEDDTPEPEKPLDLSGPKRGSLEKALTGALRQCVTAHGDITYANAPSAAKRIIGAIKNWNKLPPSE